MIWFLIGLFIGVNLGFITLALFNCRGGDGGGRNGKNMEVTQTMERI